MFKLVHFQGQSLDKKRMARPTTTLLDKVIVSYGLKCGGEVENGVKIFLHLICIFNELLIGQMQPHAHLSFWIPDISKLRLVW